MSEEEGIKMQKRSQNKLIKFYLPAKNNINSSVPPTHDNRVAKKLHRHHRPCFVKPYPNENPMGPCNPQACTAEITFSPK